MTDPFAMALGVLFRSPLAVAAVFTPTGGAPVELRVIRSSPSAKANFGTTRVVMDGNVFDVRRADVAQPKRGDLITIGSDTFVLNGAPELDVEGLSWSCPAQPA